MPERFCEQLSWPLLQTADGVPHEAEEGYAAALQVTPLGPGCGLGLGAGPGGFGVGVGAGLDPGLMETVTNVAPLIVTFWSVVL